MSSGVVSSIDEILLHEDTLEISGWVFGRPPVTQVTLSIPGTVATSRKLNYGLPSPDVAASLGSDGAAVRFHEIIQRPRDLSFRELATSKLQVVTASGTQSLPLFRAPVQFDAAADKPLTELSLGIGVTSYNRRSTLFRTLDKIQRHTKHKHHLVVADDGSTDDTRQGLAGRQIACIGFENRGVAWNKNRCLFYLAAMKRCDIVMVLEDDTFPARDRWEIEWILAALTYGHVNFLTPWLRPHVKNGAGKWHKPYLLEDRVSGQCAAFSSQALSWVGYMDTRFGRYGHEHVEHTLRMIRAGFGGHPIDPLTRSSCFYALEGNVAVADTLSHGTADDVSANGRIFDEIWNEGIYRPAWRTDLDLATIRSEMSGDPHPERSRSPRDEPGLETERPVSSGPAPIIPDIARPAYWLRSFHDTILFYDRETRSIRHGSENSSPRNLVLRVDEERGHLFALIQDPVAVRPISPERTARSVESRPHTVLLVRRLGHGKAALVLNGKFLCCEPLESRPAFDRTWLGDWETFELVPADDSSDALPSRPGDHSQDQVGSGARLTLVGDFGSNWSLASVNRRLALSLEQAMPGFCRIERRDVGKEDVLAKDFGRLAELADRRGHGDR